MKGSFTALDQAGSSGMVTHSSTASSDRKPMRSRRRRKKVSASTAAEGAGGHATCVSSVVWTEEMHSSFLHRMEAAFVHRILFGLPIVHAEASHPGRLHHHHHHNHQQKQQQLMMSTAAARLDRYVPDSAESTRDGNGCGASAPVSAPGLKWTFGREGSSSAGGDISVVSDGAKDTSTTVHQYHPLPGGRPKDLDDDNDGDQVVPLFQMTGDREPKI